MAYQQVARRTASPRDLEASLLSRSAAQLQKCREDWDGRGNDLSSALQFNRKLWNVFLTSVTSGDNPLPDPVRENIANLGLFVMKQTLGIEARPEPAKLDVLIHINRELAAGLRTTVPAD